MKVNIIKKKSSKPDWSLIPSAMRINSPAIPEPSRSQEPWRRFDFSTWPESISKAASSRVHINSATIDTTDESAQLKTLSEWKTVDELFVKKVQQAMAKMPADPRKDYFELLLKAGTNENNIPVLRIKKDSKTSSPIEVQFSNPSENTPEGLHLNPFFIYCENGSNAVIYSSRSAAAFTIGADWIFQEENSSLDYQQMFDAQQERVNNRGCVRYIKSYQEDFSQAKYGIFNMNLHLHKLITENKLQKSANVKYVGFHVGKKSHSDHDFHIVHEGSNSDSNIYFKMALMDNAYATFWGKTDVVENTKGCNAEQLNKNLILGKESRADSIPKLEISTEDVTASHGSATGELSDDELFYLTTRGLTEAEAKLLLLYGFFQDILQKSFGAESEDSSNEFKDNIWQKTLDILNINLSI